MKINKAFVPLARRESAVLGGEWAYYARRFGPGRGTYQFDEPRRVQ